MAQLKTPELGNVEFIMETIKAELKYRVCKNSWTFEKETMNNQTARATSSRLVFETVRKLTSLLTELNISMIYVVENMKMKESRFIQQQVECNSIRFLGEIPFDTTLEEAVGKLDTLLKTEFSNKTRRNPSKLEAITSDLRLCFLPSKDY